MKAARLTLARNLAQRCVISVSLADDCIQSLFRLAAIHLKWHRSLRIPGFGTFEVKTRKARRIRHPRLEELMLLPETEEIRFRPARSLTQKVTGRRPS